MSEHSAIEWTDATWNPTLGCSLVSPGCTNCYAMKLAARLHAMGNDNYRGLTDASKAGHVWSGVVRALTAKTLLLPLHWKKPRRIFVNSMSDLFHESLPDEAIDRVFAIMALAKQHTFQVLTKRPARMKIYLTAADVSDRIERAMDDLAPVHWCARELEEGLPLPNVWLGTSVEDQARADERIPLLLRTPGAKRFISAEPLLGPIELISRGWLTPFIPTDKQRNPTRIDWVIAGGESGPCARPMHPAWARFLRDQCAMRGTQFFFKQWGEWAPEHTYDPRLEPRGAEYRLFDDMKAAVRIGKRNAGRLLDGVEHSAFPA